MTICSKNDLADVVNDLRNHNSMIIKEKHISSFEVNCNNKTSGIKRISEQQSISLASMAFIDDSIREINEVRNGIPNVKAVLFNTSTIYSELLPFLTFLQKRSVHR